MDSNGTRFILLKGLADFRTASRDCGWNPGLDAFTLTRQDRPRLPHLAPARALELWEEATPHVQDDHGQIGRLSADRRRFEWSLSWPGENWQVVRAASDPASGLGESAEAISLDPVDAPAGTTFTDLHLGGSGLVALPWSDGMGRHGLLVIHLRRRWQAHCPLPFAPQRAWVDREDQVWVASREQLGLCRGAPLPQPYQPRPDRFEPQTINPEPLRLLWQETLPAHGGLMALAASNSTLVLLVQEVEPAGAQQLLVRPMSPGPGLAFTRYPLPAGLPLCTDIACLDAKQVLLLPPLAAGEARGRERDCPLCVLTRNRSGTPVAQLAPERWPRRTEAGVRFVRHRDNGVRTLSEEGVLPLYRLAQARFPHAVSAVLTMPLDSGAPGTVWHRLYLEAAIPPGCQLLIEAQAFEVWRQRSRQWQRQPPPAWLPIASELPFAKPLLSSVPERAGLFEVLLQRPSGEVRDMVGRYLRLRLTLSGDGRHTPAIHAIRAWHPRFSWQANYLPNHFQQQASSPPVDSSVEAAANAADLRERMLACLEGVLTPLEDRIAAAETLLYPDAAPAPFLPWLAEMTSSSLPRHWPEARQRRWLQGQGGLQRRRGTLAGLCQALEIITDGAVSRGQVVPVEMFRLRRTLATILGISLDDASHPLTLGSGQSGNSLVGETLILAEDQAREFLALFAPELAADKAERQVVDHFFETYARRLTVVLQGPARSLRQVVAAALPGLVPAVVQWQLLESDHPFVLGLSPLLRIDTYLEQTPGPSRVQLNRSRLGNGNLLQNPVALSPESAVSNLMIKKGDWT